MILCKNVFLTSDFRKALKERVISLNGWLDQPDTDPDKEINVARCLAAWSVYQLALKEFYNKDFRFTRTDTYYGVCTEDEEEWLFKIERRA